MHRDEAKVRVPDDVELLIGFHAIRDDKHKHQLVYYGRVYQTVDRHLVRRRRTRGNNV